MKRILRQAPFVRFILVLWAALHVTDAGAQLPPGLVSPRDVLPVIVTVSGGISRGSYQGGLNWGLVELARRSAFDTTLHNWIAGLQLGQPVKSVYIAAAGGASAGNINGLLTAIDWCRAGGSSVPEKSVFWQMWVWTGWEQLMWNKNTVRFDEHALFDRKFFGEVLKREVQNQIAPAVYRPRCRVPVGVTTTRLLPDTITVAQEIQASSQRFAIAFVVESGKDSLLHFRQPPDDALKDPSLGEILLLPNPSNTTSANADLGLDGIFKAVEASSAFPVAFAPRTLEYHKAADVLPRSMCRPGVGGRWLCDSVRYAQFLDGGVFDNNPLGLAYGLYRCVPFDTTQASLDVKVQSAPQSARDSTAFCRAPPRRAMLVYMDPDARRLDTGAQIRGDLQHGHVDGLASIPKLLGGAIATGRQYELAVFGRTVKLLEGAKYLEMEATDRYQAIVGDHFSAFGAFLGRPFREFDFYAGMFDALYFGAAEWFCPETPQGSAATSLSAETLACVQRFIGAALCSQDVFEFGVPARAVMATLFEQEFRKRVRCDESSLEDAIKRAPDTTKALVIVLQAVARANEQVRSTLAGASSDQDPFNCKDLQFLEETLCANGFRVLLDSLRTTEVKKSLAVLAATNQCKANPLELVALQGCHADATVRSLADDPIDAADELFQEILTRLTRLPNPKGLERAVEAAEMVYNSGREPNLLGFVPLPSSIPSVRGAGEVFGKMLPFQVSIAVGNPSFIIGYRPTLYTRTGFHAVFPLEYSKTVRHLRQPSGDLRAERLQAFAIGHGVGWLFANKWIQSLQATAFWGLRTDSAAYFNKRNLGLEGSAAFLFNRFRLGYRSIPTAHRGNGQAERNVVVLGLSDLNGLLYWAIRFAK